MSNSFLRINTYLKKNVKKFANYQIYITFAFVIHTYIKISCFPELYLDVRVG